MDLEYQEALEIFNLPDIYKSSNLVLWKEKLEEIYKKSLIQYDPKRNTSNESKERKILKYQLIRNAYTVLSKQLERSNNLVREEFKNIDHNQMFNGLLPSSFNPDTYKRDTSRPEIAPPDFIKDSKDFNEIFDYNMQKLKSMNQTIKANSYNRNDVFASYSRNGMEQDYQPLFTDIPFEYENKKLKNTNTFKGKSLRDIKKERELIDNELNNTSTSLPSKPYLESGQW